MAETINFLSISYNSSRKVVKIIGDLSEENLVYSGKKKNYIQNDRLKK